MDEWQKLRLARAADQDMVVTHLDCTDDAFVFTVQGMTANYLIDIAESVHLWPPTCDAMIISGGRALCVNTFCYALR